MPKLPYIVDTELNHNSWYSVPKNRNTTNNRIRNLFANMAAFDVYVCRDLSNRRAPSLCHNRGYNPNYIDSRGAFLPVTDFTECTKSNYCEFSKRNVRKVKDEPALKYYTFIDALNGGFHHYVIEDARIKSAIYIGKEKLESLDVYPVDLITHFDGLTTRDELGGYFDFLLELVY